MPCWYTTTIEIEIGNVNLSRMKEAAQAQGWTVRETKDGLILYKGDVCVTIRNGVASVDAPNWVNADTIVNELKREYTIKTVAAGARRFGWEEKRDDVRTTSTRRKITLTR